MKPILVTGANGHVGNNLCRMLVARGENVRAMIRPAAETRALDGLGVEIVRGDVLDRASVERAVAGTGRVIHAAAGFLMWSKDPERDIVAPSVEGTRNVLEAAARAGVEKVLYVSTSGTIGFLTRPGAPRDESHFNAEPHTWYVKGKIAAEKEAFAIRERTKMPVTAVNPGFILGPRFFKPSESVKQILDFINQPAPIYFDGGFGTVDVDDVCRCALLGMEKGGDGERYIASGDDVTVKQLFELIGEFTGQKAPSIRMPPGVLRVMAGAMELASRITGTRPLLDRSQVDEFAGKFGYFDNGKSVRELGYSWLPAREVVRRTVAWAVDAGFVRDERKQALRLSPDLRGAY